MQDSDCEIVWQFPYNYLSPCDLFACDFFPFFKIYFRVVVQIYVRINFLSLFKTPAKHKKLEPCVKQVYNTMHSHRRSHKGWLIVHTWNIACHFKLSYYTNVHLSVTPYAAGSSHNLLSDIPHNESDWLWMYSTLGCNVAGSIGTQQVLHLSIQMQLILWRQKTL